MKISLVLTLLLGAAVVSTRAEDPKVKQIDTSAVFNARPIDTVVNGKVVPMDNNIDGAGGLATVSAAKLLGGSPEHAIPDDAVYPANDKHPEVVLAYANDDGKKFFARRHAQGEDSFDLTIPEGNYAKLFLLVTSGQGASDIDVTLTYKDGTTENKPFTVPDWWPDLKPPVDAYCTYVVFNMSKWTPKGIIGSELSHHNIFGLNIGPNPDKALVKVTVHKHQKGIMCFWGATGVLK
ncbi:MAG TPA: hypothetical protein VG733_14190 [Chthoniobacteraceae bacterium]|nr:hypothetical protein [Verrucomicrobiae bacterium]HWB60640.1 hypothetical protein [Chthoniobacteraceae bacterium]